MEDLWMKKDEVFTSPLASIKPRRLNGEWDYISSPISKFELRDTDNIDPNHQTLLLKSAILDTEDLSTNEGSKQSWSYINNNLDDSEGSWSDYSASNASKQSSVRKRNCWAAPPKKQNKRKYKEILKELDKKEFSFPMSRLNEAFENPEPLFDLPDHDDGLSLEEHILRLSNQNSNEVELMSDDFNQSKMRLNSNFISENLNVINFNDARDCLNTDNEK